MFDFIVYLGQSALCLVALYLIYKVTMSQETLFRLNRCLLLGVVMLSAILPMCRIRIVKECDVLPATAIEINGVVDVEAIESDIDYIMILKVAATVAYIVGVAFMVVRLVVGLYSVRRLVYNGRMSVIEDGVTITIVDTIVSPFSWFGHIVVSDRDMLECRQMILSHEMAHVRFGHSWDVLAVDLALCLWWFNPAMWLLRRELQSLHEYQADDVVLSNGIDAKIYQMLLIKRAVGSRLHSVANCLNHSNLKNRITMMCKQKSSRWSATKVLLVLPMVALALSAFATTVYVETNSDNKVIEKNEKNKENAILKVRLEGETIYFNGKQVSYDKLAKYLENHKGATLNISVADNHSKENFTKVNELACQNNNLKVTYTQLRFQELEDAVETQQKVQNLLDTIKDVKFEAGLPTAKMPMFQGGDLNLFRNWIQSNVHYPEEAATKGISGRVLFSFVVEKDGTISSFEVINSPDELLSDEVERVFKVSPADWTAGEDSAGEKISVRLVVPIVFALNNGADPQYVK